MATKDALEVDSLTRQLTALKVQASSRSVPDPRLNKQIMDLQQQLMKKKAGSVDSPTTALRKGGVVKKKKQVAAKVKKVMGEFKEGTLHSGKNGKVVKDKGQAIAIALAQARKAKK